MTFLPHSFSRPSQESRGLRDTEGLLTLLPSVMADVADQAFFTWAEPCEDRRFAEFVTKDDGALWQPALETSWLSARIGFRGAVAGSLEIRLPRELALDLGLAMLGASEDVTLTDEQLDDVTGELANMLCGALLTRAGREQQFDLRPPEIARVPALAEPDGRPGRDVFFCVNDRPMVVRFDVGDSQIASSPGRAPRNDR